jgi:dolichol kinase
MPAAIWLLEYKESLLLFGTLTLFIFIIEILRKHSPKYRKFFHYIFGNILRSHENDESFTGAFYVSISALLSIILFPKIIAITALSIMLISDSFAALVGKKYGIYKLMSKSLEGSLAFFISGICVVTVIYYLTDTITTFLYSGIFASAIGTIVELFSKKLKLDDNLTITIAVGSIMIIFN